MWNKNQYNHWSKYQEKYTSLLFNTSRSKRLPVVKATVSSVICGSKTASRRASGHREPLIGTSARHTTFPKACCSMRGSGTIFGRSDGRTDGGWSPRAADWDTHVATGACCVLRAVPVAVTHRTDYVPHDRYWSRLYVTATFTILRLLQNKHNHITETYF